MTSHQHYDDNIIQGRYKQTGYKNEHNKGQLERGKGIKDHEIREDSSEHRDFDGYTSGGRYYTQQIKKAKSDASNARAQHLRGDKENRVRVNGGQFETRLHMPLSAMARRYDTDGEYHERKHRHNQVTYQQTNQQRIQKTQQAKRLSNKHNKPKTKIKEPRIDKMFNQFPDKISERSTLNKLKGGSLRPWYGPYPPPQPSYDARQVRQVEQNGLQAAVVPRAAGYNAEDYNEPQRLSFQIHGQEGPNSYRFGHDTGLG